MMKRIKTNGFGVVAAAMIGLVCMPGCLFLSFGVQGSGVSASEQRTTEEFDSVSLSGSGDINIQCGSEHSVSVTVDDNLMELIETKVNGGKLSISSTESYSSRLGLKVDITAPVVKSLNVSGACDANIENCVTDRFDLEVSGAGDVKVTGKVDSVTIEVSGAGDVDISELEAKNVKVELSGAASAKVFATEKLNVNISGVGSVEYKGSPEVKKNVSGMGSVDKMD